MYRYDTRRRKAPNGPSGPRESGTVSSIGAALLAVALTVGTMVPDARSQPATAFEDGSIHSDTLRIQGQGNFAGLPDQPDRMEINSKSTEPLLEAPRPEDIFDLWSEEANKVSTMTAGGDDLKNHFRMLLNKGFDIPEIGRFVLGRYWRRASEIERSEFLVAFEDMMLHRFLPIYSEYSDGKFDIGEIRPFTNNPDFVSVKSQLLRSDGDPIRIDWRLRRRDRGYKILDVVAEGVSIALTLRSEYVSALKQNGGSVDALTRVLRAKISGF